MDRIQEYYKNALLADLCSEYKGKWASCHSDKESLLKLSLSQQSIPHVVTFAYQGKGVTKEYIKENFSDYINGYTIHDADGVHGYDYALYVDWDYENDIVADKDVMSLMWCKDTTVSVPQCKCPTIYVSNNSDVSISCDGFNSIRVYLFDESKVVIDDADENCEVIVYKYSNRADVDTDKFCLANVKIFLKTLRL